MENSAPKGPKELLSPRFGAQLGRWGDVKVRTQNFQTKKGEVLGFSERYPIFF